MLNRTDIKTINIDKIIKKYQEKDYIEMSFIVDEKIEKIEIDITVIELGNEKSVIDLGVRDIKKVRGWSGGARESFYIMKEKATPGYLSGEILPGKWAVLLGTYKVAEQGCIAKLTIKLYKRYLRWFKGDFHTHTEHSDGTYKLADVEKIAREKGLDFVATTDHNTITQNYVHVEKDDIIFIPGMELTTYWGHANILGVKNPIDDFRCLNYEDLKRQFCKAKEKGAKIVLNHPFCDYCSWQFGFDVDFDVIEIWNGPWREVNQRALTWWHNKLVQGKRIHIIGGSDSHRPDKLVQHGLPTTWVFTDEKAKGNILEAINKGHSFVSYSPQGPMIEMKCGNYVMGDSIDKSSEIDIKCTGLINKDIIKIISNEGIKKRIVENQKIFNYSFKIEREKFIRIEVWRYFELVDQYLLASLSNPIYIKGDYNA